MRQGEQEEGHHQKPLYVDEAGNTRKRVVSYELRDEWKKQRDPGEVLRYMAAPVSPKATRQWADAAVIFHHKPVVNDEYTHSFPFDTRPSR